MLGAGPTNLPSQLLPSVVLAQNTWDASPYVFPIS
jgi:hypothetical protein